MHAGHERVLYEKMKKDLKADRLSMQALLIPVSVPVNTQERQCFLDNQDAFSKSGLSVDQSGPDTLLVRAVPLLLKNKPIDQLMRDILSDLIEVDASRRIDDMVDVMLGTIACKSAIKAHHHLSIDEMNGLLRTMENTPHGGLCNHGRPAWKQISMREVDQWFLRGQ
jgi:DNA mismatch repair protein MutL